MIKVNDLTKNFGEFTAVDHISFEVEKGKIFGLLGPNGAGKSTTIRMLSTLTKPSDGTATIGGYDIVKKDSKVRHLIGLVSEKMIMYDRLTAKENLWFFGKLYNLSKEDLHRRIDELLKLVQLSKWKNAQVGTFSTGMRQRMNLIRGLLNMPKVLFLDEPTLGLDPQSSVEVREFIKKINIEDAITIIITTHKMVEADLLCDQIGIIDQGKIVALDTSINLKTKVSGNDTTILKIAISNLTGNIVKSIRSLEFVDSVSQDNSTYIKIIAHSNESFDKIIDSIRGEQGKIKSIENLQPTLEDVFLHITGHEVQDRADQKIPMNSHRHSMSGPKRRVR